MPSIVHEPNFFSHTLPWVVFFAFALLAAVLDFTIVARLLRAGVSVRLFLMTPSERFRIYGIYREMAPGKNWSVWPVYGFWAILGGLLVLAILVAFLHV